MAAQEAMELKRLLKPGDVKVAVRPTRAPLFHSNGSSFQPLVKPSQSLTPIDPAFSHSYLRPNENHPFTTFPSQSLEMHHQPDTSFANLSGEKRYNLKSESETTLSSIFPRRSGVKSGSNPSFDLSTPSSPESDECLTYRMTSERKEAMRRVRTIHPYNSTSTQTERSPFEEKFLFRESILLGCDLISTVTQKMPPTSTLREYSEYVKEKTIQSRAQNVCSRLVHKAKEPEIIAEYIKTFFRIADTWLDIRNCFGTSGQCSNETCSLDTRELTISYVDWMHVSRVLLNSIIKGLETTLKNEEVQQPSVSAPTESMLFGAQLVISKSMEQIAWSLPPGASTELEAAGGVWGFPPNTPCHCTVSPSPPPSEIPSRGCPQNEPNTRFKGQVLPLYPSQSFSVNELTECGEGYLKPFGYDVPRNNMTNSQKGRMVTAAKSTCFEDKVEMIGYVVTILNSQNKKDEQSYEDKEGSDVADSKDMESKKVPEFESGNLRILTSEEWLLPKVSEDEGGMKETELDDDSDSLGSVKGTMSDVVEQNSSPSNGLKIQKPIKSSPKYIKRRLSHHDLNRIQEIVQKLWKNDLPEYMKHSVKHTQQYYKIVKHPIFLETITNKTKNGVYETLEQFVHDCRRLILNAALYCQKENLEPEKITKLTSKVESLLENSFEQYRNWTYISGDPKEVNYYPELKYTNARKRSKFSKNQQTAFGTCRL